MKIPRLMLVTGPGARPLKELVSAAVEGGVDGVLLRGSAENLREITRNKAKLIVYGDFEGESDGIHSRADESLLVRSSSIRGKSIHTLDEAREAEIQGADYILAGTIFPSPSHPDIAPAGLDFLDALAAAVAIPIVAIGGITPANAASCLKHGASGVAVLSGIMNAQDPRAAARKYRDALDTVKIIELAVNGTVSRVAAPVSIAQYLKMHGLEQKLVVVEHNRAIVPRPRYDEILLGDGDNLEIVHMTAGG